MMNIRKLCSTDSRTPLTLIVSFLLLGVIISSTPTVAEENPVLVVINSDSITVDDIKQEIVSKHRDLSNTDKSTFDYRNLLNKLVNDRLIIQEAVSMGIDEEPWLIDKLDEMMRIRARKAYVRGSFKPDITIGQEELRKFFDEYYFRMKLRTITVASHDEALEIKKLVENGAAMDSLAKEISIDTKKSRGGAHNLLHYADIENVLRIPAQKMKVNEVSEPIPYREAFIIIRLEDYKEPDTLEFPLLSIRIEKILKAEKQQQLWDAFVDSLKNLTPLTVNQALFDSIRTDAADIFTQEFQVGSSTPVFSLSDTYYIDETAVRSGISYVAMTAGDLTTDSMIALGVNNLTMELYLDYEADKHGYADNPEMNEFYRKALDSSLVDLFLQEVIAKQITFNHQEFEDYYQTHLEEFQEMPDFQLAHLVFSTEDSAMMVYERLRQGATFDFVAAQVDPNNMSESNPNKWESLLAFPEEIQQDLKSLQVGGYSRPYEVSRGWVLFYVKNKRAGRQLSLEEADTKIRKIMFQMKFDELLTETLDLLKNNSTIEYYTERIDSFFN